jgi:hypothetical protein
MANIVISYRREDTRWIVGRIFDRLKQRYGRDNVFMDIDAVPLGLDYRDHIRNTLDQSDIVLAVIGPQWLGVQSAGQPRITDETDWVRIEIEAALGKKIPLIPILVDRTPLPKLDELPEKVRDLAFRQAISIDTGRDFDTHIERLIREMDQLLDRQSRVVKPATKPQSEKTDLHQPSKTQSFGSLSQSSTDRAGISPLYEVAFGKTPSARRVSWILLIGFIIVIVVILLNVK